MQKIWVSFICLWPAELDHWFAMYVLLSSWTGIRRAEKRVFLKYNNKQADTAFRKHLPTVRDVCDWICSGKVTLARTGVLPLTISVGGRAHANTEHTALVCKFQADCFYSNLADEKFNFCLERIFGTYICWFSALILLGKKRLATLRTRWHICVTDMLDTTEHT